MKCFLHIGTEKTATSTLQNFFDLNRDELYKFGVIYTEAVGKANNRALPVTAYDLARRDDFTKSKGIYTNKDLSDFQKNMITKLSKELQEKSRKNVEAKVIFSSEHIQSRLTNLDEIQRLKEILNGLGLYDISVIIYLRNPAEIANSLLSTVVKSGGLSASPPPPTDKYFANICNHQNTIEKFSSVFGESSLLPRIFHKNEFNNGSILDDFIDATGMPAEASYVIPENRNLSLSITGIEILRRLNKLVPVFIDDKLNPLRANIVSYFEKHFSHPKYIMPSSLFEKYNIYFHDSNEWVRKKYFPDKKTLFHNALCPTESKLNLQDEELNAVVNIIASIWNDKQQQIVNLKRRST
jgi:hypothetical protein